jgi:glutamyl/glutaminyl-tRNA synthetase
MSNSSGQIVRTRFAPSPSGHLHVGGARTALFCWVYAKKHQGKFALRIEDTDQKRSSDAASMAFLADLKWLGIEWDEGPEFEGFGGKMPGVDTYFQSQRLAIYNEYFENLIREGKAYRAFETPQELDAVRTAAQKEKRPYRYDRAALKLSQAQIEEYIAAGRPHVVRFKIPDDCKQVVFRDEVRGDVATDRAELDDFVIRKADGFPMYNFAVVIDDELMGVTHVIRAQEHLSNTPRHVLLQEALGFRRPAFAHISIITNPDGSKMSKRDKDKALRAAVKQRGLASAPVISSDRWAWWLSDSDHQLNLNEAEQLADFLQIELPEINVDDFRRHGYLPEVMVNYLALLGWSPGGDVEKFDREFLLEKFSLDRIIKSPAKFDRDKLLAFNLDALQAMPADAFVKRLREHAEQFHPEFVERLSPAQFDLFARANQARSKTLDDPIKSGRFFVMADDDIVYEDSKAVREAMLKGEPNGYAHLEGLLPLLKEVGDWSPHEIEAAVKGYAEQHAGGKLGKVAQPLRVAVSGGVVSPAIFDTLAILGKQATLKRIERCLASRLVQTA